MSRTLEERITMLEQELVEAKRSIQKKDYIISGLKKQLDEEGIRDQLTGIYNKHYLIPKFKQALNFQKRFGCKVTIGVLDIDNFRLLNENFGTEYGDAVLSTFTTIAKRLIRDDFDSVFRLGGDEFLILMLDCDKKSAKSIMKRLSHSFKIVTEGQSLSFSVVEISSESSLDHLLTEAKSTLTSYELVN